MATFDPSSLDGTNGFTFSGSKENSLTGKSVSTAGDVNGDGLNDILIGIPQYIDDPTGHSGSVALIYGSNSPFPSQMGATDLNGSNGALLQGLSIIPRDHFGDLVGTAGDINGDGFDDLLIRAHAFSSGSQRIIGRSYVVYGSNSLPAIFKIDSLNGTNGFYFDGHNSYDGRGLQLDTAGDINNDGYDDIVVGIPDYESPGKNESGKISVIFGKSTPFPLSFDLNSLNGSNGFTILGSADKSYLGYGVAHGGDFNNDGIDDVVFSAQSMPQPSGPNLSEVYVFYGRNIFNGSYQIDALNPIDATIILGSSDSVKLGSALGNAGDFNGEGINDIIIGEPQGGLAKCGWGICCFWKQYAQLSTKYQ